MSESKKGCWYFDLLGMIASGLFIGYFRQRIADSGVFYLDEILKSMVIAGGAYLLAFLILVKRQRGWRIPNWVIMAVVGSAVCSFSLHVVKYAIDNWIYRRSDSVVNYLLMRLPEMAEAFIALTIIYSLIAVCIMGVIRLLVAQLNALRGV